MNPRKIRGTQQSWSKHILIIGDGFTTNQMGNVAGQFEHYARQVAATIAAQSWYQSSLCIWIADTPVTAANTLLKYDAASCGAIAQPLPPTRFTTKYGSGAFCRVLKGSVSKVNDIVWDLMEAEQLPDIKATLVLVNFEAYGGSGSGDIAWASVAPGVYTSLAVHELGHTFGLLDEYENKCGSADGAGPNISAVNISSNPASPLWYQQADAYPNAPAVALKANPTDCEVVPPNPSFTVGSYQGGYYTHTRYYRPSDKCCMRKIGDPCCTVCHNAISTQI